MKAVRLARPGELAVVEVEPPVPGPGEVVVDVAYAGVCGSDVELLRGRRPEGFAVYPLIPGHEWSGVVRATGPDVDAALIGRNVVGEGFRGCRACRWCAAGDAVLCETGYDEIGFTRPGAWAEQLVIPARQLHLLDAGVDLRAAAALEPAACSAATVAAAAIAPGERVAVVGAGTIGALAVQLARAAGPAEIVVVEPDPQRAATAARCGATHVVAPEHADDLRGSCDVVIEAAGAHGTATLALGLARRGGRLVLAGIPGPDAVLPVAALVAARVTVATVFGAPSAAWRAAVDAFREGHLDPAVLITHTLPIDHADRALALVAGGAEPVGKVVLSHER